MYKIFLYIALLLGLFPILFFYIKGKSKFSEPAKSFLPFLYLTAFSSLYEFLGSYIAGLDVAIWFRIYGFLEFSVLSYFFYHLLPIKIRWAVYSLTIVFFIEYTFFIVFVDSSKQLWIDGILNCTTFSLIILGVFYYFTQRFKVLQSGDIKSDWPVFYFTGSVLLYYSSTFFLFLMAHSVFANNHNDFGNFWVLNVITTVIFRAILTLGIWKA